VRASTLSLCVWRARGTQEPSENATSFVPLPRLGSFQHTPPFFGHNECSVYVTLREVYLPTLLEVFGQSFEHFAQNPLLDPLLKATVAGLVGRVAIWEVLPGSPGAQYPEDAVQDIAWVSPGPAPPIFSSRWLWDKRLQYFPLLVCEVHSLHCFSHWKGI
jgi:hypothetical protein